MENKNSEIILNRVLESILLEQTGLVYVGPPDKKKQDGPGALGFISEWGTIFVWAAGLLTTTFVGRFLGRRWVAIKAAGGISKIGWKDLLSFQRNIGTPKGIAKLKRQCQRDVLNGKMTTEERNEIFSLLADQQVLQSIREKVFDDVLYRFKRGRMPAKELIAHLDLKTAREVGPVLRQMEKDGLAGTGIKDAAIPEVPKSIAKIKKLNLPVKTEEEFNKKIQQLDKKGKLKKIYGETFYNKWKRGEKGSGNWLSRSISLLRDQTLRGEAYVYKANVKTIDDYVKLLKFNDVPVPSDVGDLNYQWKQYQLKQLFIE